MPNDPNYELMSTILPSTHPSPSLRYEYYFAPYSPNPVSHSPPPISPSLPQKKPVNKCLSKAEAGEVRQSPKLCVWTIANTGAISAVRTIVTLSLGWAALCFENEMIGLVAHDKCVIHESCWGMWLISGFIVSISQPMTPFLLAVT